MTEESGVSSLQEAHLKVIKLLNQNSYYHFPSQLDPENTKSGLKAKTSETSHNAVAFLF